MTEKVKHIKKCPFCGGNPTVIESDFKFFIHCQICSVSIGERYDGCSMPDHLFSSKKEALQVWNTRVTRSERKI